MEGFTARLSGRNRKPSSFAWSLRCLQAVTSVCPGARLSDSTGVVAGEAARTRGLGTGCERLGEMTRARGLGAPRSLAVRGCVLLALSFFLCAASPATVLRGGRTVRSVGAAGPGLVLDLLLFPVLLLLLLLLLVLLLPAESLLLWLLGAFSLLPALRWAPWARIGTACVSLMCPSGPTAERPGVTCPPCSRPPAARRLLVGRRKRCLGSSSQPV